MNTIKFIVVVSIALLVTNLIHHQVVNGQVSERPNPVRNILEHGLLTSIDREVTIEPTPGLVNIAHQIDEINTVLDYCYQHANEPNPVLDLVNKRLVNFSMFASETCGSVKQRSDNIPNATFVLKADLMRQLCKEDPPRITPEECQGTLR